MAERGFFEKTDPRAIGYCPVCRKPFKWHAGQLDYSVTLGVRPIWVCQKGHGSITDQCATCKEERPADSCHYVDESRSGYGWGMATRKPAREYATGARVTNEICGYQNPGYPGYPCLKKRGHDEESELGVGHDHGYVPMAPPKRTPFSGYKEKNGIYVEEP